MRETDILKLLQCDAPKKNAQLWRNNSGAVHTVDGRFIRFGLGNESQKINQVFKSSDLIGFKKITITEDMVGQTVAIFLAREVKRPNWKFKGTKHEVGQKNFIDYINNNGGDAAFTTSDELELTTR